MLFVCALAVLLAAAQSAPPEEDPREMAVRLRKTVSEIRGLELRREVPVGIYSELELRRYGRAEIDRQLPPEKARRTAKAAAHFGLVPEGFDPRLGNMLMIGYAVGGFYDPRAKELRLVMNEDTAAQLESLMFHELVHAAQDQAFDLATLPPYSETFDGNDDLALAVSAVVEGDAELAQLKYAARKDEGVFREAVHQLSQAKDNVELPWGYNWLPDYLPKTFFFPYTYGTDFVKAYTDRHGSDLKATSGLFERLPTSTEQIIHPEKYLSEPPDWPTEISFDDIGKTLGTGDRILDANVFGEYVTRMLVGEKAAEGWDGDRYVVFENAGGTYSVWYTTWDSEEEAREFFEKYATGCQGAPSSKESDRLLWNVGNGRYLLVERRGRDVLVMKNVPESLVSRADDVFAAAKKRELSTVERIPAKPMDGSEKLSDDFGLLDAATETILGKWDWMRWLGQTAIGNLSAKVRNLHLGRKVGELLGGAGPAESAPCEGVEKRLREMQREK